MRHLLWSAAVTAACGAALGAACGSSNSKKPKDGSGSADAAPPDATPLPACASPVHGTTMNAVMVGRVSGVATLATSPFNDPRLFVLEEQGRIRVFDQNRQLLATPFLDISNQQDFAAGGEQGLLGLAFHPQYATNGYFYIWYTNGTSCPGSPPPVAPCANVLERFTVSAADPNQADPNSGVVILSIPDFATNHNAGMLEFGSDGYLYISTGDGGSGGDPARNGQNPNALLAKILRIDVDHPANGQMYGTPADNPYAGGGGAPEVYLMGVRNPWRWTFDRGTGDMWIADVGQNCIEELDVLRAGTAKGANLGWSAFEANQCCATEMGTQGADKCNGLGGAAAQPCDPTGKVFPQVTWSHGGGTCPDATDSGFRAVIGGQVYRGTCYPDIVGNYYFSDNSAGGLLQANFNADNSVTVTSLPAPSGGWPGGASSIHADARGELYETTIQGYVYQLVAGP
jgi:glucose/arabinose dehydrogenase